MEQFCGFYNIHKSERNRIWMAVDSTRRLYVWGVQWSDNRSSGPDHAPLIPHSTLIGPNWRAVIITQPTNPVPTTLIGGAIVVWTRLSWLSAEVEWREFGQWRYIDDVTLTGVRRVLSVQLTHSSSHTRQCGITRVWISHSTTAPNCTRCTSHTAALSYSIITQCSVFHDRNLPIT